MSPFLALVAVGIVVVAANAISRRGRRQRLLARIRADWGKPNHRGRKMDAIAEYHHSIVEAAGAQASLDNRTWDDLNLDAVFQVIDRTESTLGQQALYHRLRTAPVADNLVAFEALVNRMTVDAPARERVQMALARLQDPAGYDLWWLARPDSLERQPWHILFPAWAATVLVALAITPWWPRALMIPLAGLALNLVVRIRTAWRVSSLIGPFRQVGALIAAAETLQFINGSEIETITGCLGTELPRFARLKTITRWVSRDPLTSGELIFALWEYLNLLFLLDVNALYFAARELGACGASLLRVIAAVGEVDAAVGVASFRAGTSGWTRPHFHASGTPAVLTGVRHPLVTNAVPNSIVLGPPHGVLVTGSNMSGKSTFLRTVGVTAVLAQTINTCLAAAYDAPIFSVQSCIGRADDLIAGKSYYIIEVEEILARVQASAEARPHLFLFDELFRGTNAVERIAAAEAVLRELIGDPGHRKPHVVLAATHDAELVDLLHDSYRAYHFTDTISPEGLVFEYRLESGPATTRNAIALLELHGAPASVVSRALTRAAALDRQRRNASGLTRA